jgi:hypothetical protein
VPKSLDTAESLVVSATLVCRIHHDAGKIMIKFDEHLTSLGGSIVMFHIPILDMLVPVRYCTLPFNKHWHVRKKECFLPYYQSTIVRYRALEERRGSTITDILYALLTM